MPPALRHHHDLVFLSLAEASELVRTGRVSPVDLTNAMLERIERLQPVLNAFITVTAAEALNAARVAEAEIRHGQWRGPLHGIPIGLKDAFDTAGVQTTAGSRVFLERVPDADAEVVRRLREAGAVVLGKLNMDEFSGGVGISWTGYFGEVHNPWDLTRYAGAGSSTGPAAALAAGLCYGALGTDSGGSVRGPAAGCGIVGLKPTYGRVSKRGVIPYSWSFDHVGPMGRRVVDAALMLQVIAGYDDQDTTTLDVAVPDYTASLWQDPHKLRLGIPRAGYFDELNREVEAAVNQAISVLCQLTASTQEIALDRPPNRSTVKQPESYTFHLPYVTQTPELYPPEALDALHRYATIPASQYIQDRRDLVDFPRRAVAGIFADVDVLATPTVWSPPHRIGDPDPDGYFKNMTPFNTYGLPAITVPCGFTSDGLPIGLQLIGPHWAEGTVLQLANAYERATPWHERHPML
jgi:aspartyl-tRNA(Asn)/glutamyl-tRNA(Gln) amidotransferase subunit A